MRRSQLSIPRDVENQGKIAHGKSSERFCKESGSRTEGIHAVQQEIFEIPEEKTQIPCASYSLSRFEAGDIATVAECRPISKTVSFVVVDKTSEALAVPTGAK